MRARFSRKDSKFHAKKVTLPNGVKFDSKLEFERWCFLSRQLELGLIRNLERQVSFVLIPKQTKSYVRLGKNGRMLKAKERIVEKECRYNADFVYELLVDSNLGIWTQIVEDTKSKITRTPAYRIKKKLMLFFHHVEITEIDEPNQLVNDEKPKKKTRRCKRARVQNEQNSL